MSEAIPHFGVFRPIAQAHRELWASAADESCARVNRYLRSITYPAPVAVRDYFGISIISREIVSRHLRNCRATPKDFDVFINEVRTHLRPNESDNVQMGLSKIVFPDGAKSWKINLELARINPGFERLQAEISLATTIFQHVFGPRPAILIHDELTLLSFSDRSQKPQPPLPIEQRKAIGKIISGTLIEADLTSATFGPTVLGVNSYDPLPGT